MNATAVLIARFQTPYLHEGHRHLINTIRAKHNRVIIVLGVAPVKGSKRNPFDFYTRERLLKKEYPELVVLPLSDHPSDKVWSSNLDDLLRNHFPAEGFILYGSRDSFIPFYNGHLPVQELPEWGHHSATAIRTQYADKVMDSEDFRLGINYAYHNLYSKVYPTVDIALFKEHRKYLLMGKKKGRPEWRLPGGFTDVADVDFEAAAHRELMEECGQIETGPMQYIASVKIDDWRYRNEEDKIITLLFATDLVYGAPAGADDLEEVNWLEVSDLQNLNHQNAIAKEHEPLIDRLLAHLRKTPETTLLS